MLIEHEKTLVIPDLHGRPEILGAVLKEYTDADHLILAGDFINGRDTKEVLDILAEQDPERVTILLGNHEWVLAAAMYEQDQENRTVWAEEMWQGPYHDRVLRSYGIPGSPSLSTANQLHDVMPSEHHEIFRRAELFAETVGDVVVHAGLLDAPWSTQRAYLTRRNECRRAGDYGEGIPLQLCGEHVMTEIGVATSALEKRLITGHWHQSDKKRRVKAGGRLIHLAGLTEMGHIPVYETWTQQINHVAA